MTFAAPIPPRPPLTTMFLVTIAAAAVYLGLTLARVLTHLHL